MAELNQDGIRELKDVLHCPVCESDIVMVRDMQNPQPVRKGNIVVCGHCASICQVGDSDLVKMSKQEVDALDPQSRSILALTCAGIASEIAKRNGGIIET